MKAKAKQNALKGLNMTKCKYCWKKADEARMTIDHKHPKIKGGQDKLKNLQCLCNDCNVEKGSHSEGELKVLWRWFLSMQKSRIKRGKNPMFKKEIREIMGLYEERINLLDKQK